MTLLRSLTAAYYLAAFVTAQLDLPGLDESSKPGDSQGALDSVLDCGQKTNDLLNIADVYNSLVDLRQAAAVKLQNSADACVENSDGSFVCTLDYQTLPSDYKSVCETNGGVYDENDHQVSCTSDVDPTMTGPVVYRFTNYPTCFSSDCTDSDLERWIADEVDDFEISIEQDTAWVCDSSYVIETTAPDQSAATISGTTGTCPNRAQDTADKCGPLAANRENQMCDCYAFCDGKLVECDKFDSTGASQVFCTGDLVMGCTNALFEQYGVEQGKLMASAMTLSVVTVATATAVLAMIMMI